jgi:mannose-1-phosphate guanylyltransferase/mannose-6-phosphate isomerase
MLVDMLKAQNRREALRHRRVDQPWGFHQRVDAGPRHRVRRIAIRSGARLSLQTQFDGPRHWVVVRGTAEVSIKDDVRIVHENESIDFPVDGVHRVANPGKILLELIEIKVGNDLGGDDIVGLDGEA